MTPTTPSYDALSHIGSIGGAVEACCLQPIDVVKTRMQLDQAGKYKGHVRTREGLRDDASLLRNSSLFSDSGARRRDTCVMERPDAVCHAFVL